MWHQRSTIDQRQNQLTTDGGLDIENLIARGHIELAKLVCDAELDRLLRIKSHILERMNRPSLFGNVGVLSQDGLNPVVLHDECFGQGFKLGSICACLGTEVGFVNHKMSIGANVPVLGTEIGNNGDRLNGAGIVDVHFKGKSAEEIIEADAIANDAAS